MQPRARSTSHRPGAGSYSKMYGAGSATALTATATGGASDAATLSIKDVQRCFEKERRAFLRDLESLRQQLVKKDQVAAKAAAVASQHTVQLKKEIASLQAALSASEKESAAHAEQFRHTSALLETALDQHQADQAKVAELTETVRTMERKHEDALALVKKESAASVTSTHEERKALRTRVDQLRAKLESERKEFLAVKTPLGDELAKANVRLSVLEKELQESRYRETASVQLKDKMQAEVVQYKRKVADLSSALQDALTGKSEMKAAHQLLVGKMKDKWRDVLTAHAQAKEQLVMLQEDYNGLFRSRARVAEQSERVVESMRALKQRHEQQLKEKDNEYWDLEKRFKRNSATCTVCMKTPEQRQEALEAQLDAAREATRLQVTKEMELERWDRFQDVNARLMDVSSQLQAAMRDGDQLGRELKTVSDQHEQLQLKEKKLVEMLSRAEKRIQELERKASDDAQRSEESKRQIQDLMENLSKMTTVTADQSKQLHELELGRREEVERMKDAINAVDAEKLQLIREKDELQQQLDQQLDAYAQLQAEKAKQWNEIMGAQLSANLLIEEQAHTIDTLLKKSRYVSPSKSKMGLSGGDDASPQLRSERETSGVSDSAPSSSSPSSSPSPGADDSATVMVLRHECEVLRDELTKCKAVFAREKEKLQSGYEEKVVDLMRELTTLQRERATLKRRLDEQAVTIHELTLQDDEDEDEDEDENTDEQDDHKGYNEARSDDELEDQRRPSIVRPLHRNHSKKQSLALHGHLDPRLEWTPKQRPSRSQPRAPKTTRIRRAPRSSDQYDLHTKDLSAMRPESDEDATVGMSFLSTTFS